MSELQSLLNYAIEIKNQNLIKKVASAILKYSYQEECIVQAQSLFPDAVDIDLWELESLVHPTKFDFPEPSIGQINVENENPI